MIVPDGVGKTHIACYPETVGLMKIQSILCAEADPTQGDYVLAPHVIFLRIQDGSARLLDLGGEFYTLSQTGAQMLEETLTEGTTAAANHIATHTHAELSRVQNDLHTFLHALEDKHLIFQTQQSHNKRKNKNILPCLLLTPLLRCIALFPGGLEKKTWLLLLLASVAIRLFEWPQTVASWRYYFQKYPSSCPTTPLEQAVKEIDIAVRTVAARHPLHMECKERALSCWWLLCCAGFASKLVLGVSLFPLECHCWCEVEQFVLSDNQERCERFTPILFQYPHFSILKRIEERAQTSSRFPSYLI